MPSVCLSSLSKGTGCSKDATEDGRTGTGGGATGAVTIITGREEISAWMRPRHWMMPSRRAASSCEAASQSLKKDQQSEGRAHFHLELRRVLEELVQTQGDRH